MVRTWSRLGIAGQLYLLGAVVFLPIAALIGHNIYGDYREAVAEASRNAFGHARHVADETERFHRQSFEILQGLARRPAISAMSRAPCDSVFDHFLSANKFYANLLLDNADGDVICNAAMGPNLKGLVTHRPWFKSLMATGKRQVGDPTVGQVVGRWINALAEPVLDDAGRVRGALVLTVDLWNYQFHLDSNFKESLFLVTIFDSRGAVVARSREPAQWVGKRDQVPFEALRSIQPGDTGFVSDGEGVEQLYGYASVPGTDWMVLVSSPKNTVTDEVLEHIQFELTLAGSMMVLLFAAAFLIAKRIQGPIQAIARAAEAVGDGRFDVRLQEAGGNRELSILAQKFNRMAEQRKVADARLRLAASVFDNAAEGILITDTDNNILSVNRAFTEITGYSAQEAIGKNPSLLNSGQHVPGFYQEMWASINANGQWWGEVWDRRKSGELYCESLSISAVRNEQGKITNYCAVFADITKRKTAETELTRLNVELEQRVATRTQELERANRELDAFSYSVSHDLRAPLRAITGFSSIVAEANRDKLDAESIEHLGRIQSGAQRMTRLIDDLLDLARISRQEMLRTDFNLSAMAAQVTETLAQAHPQRKVRLTMQPDMHANGDTGLVRIVLENLVGNAWKFTSHVSEAAVRIGSEVREGQTVYFVRDNGAGFDMRYADRLFAPFQRLHGDTEFEGTGIGLSIVHRIVSRHRGKVWAESKEGEGASFYFTLGESGPILLG